MTTSASAPTSPSTSKAFPMSLHHTTSSDEQSAAKASAIFENARNLRKAWEDHGMETKFDESIFAYDPAAPQLSFSHNTALEKGIRPLMEDFVLFEETDNYILGAVFDGHGGSEAAQFCSDNFSQHFRAELLITPMDVKGAFTRTMKIVHEKILSTKIKGGTTACVCYIDKSDNTLYIATVADSEAKL